MFLRQTCILQRIEFFVGNWLLRGMKNGFSNTSSLQLEKPTFQVIVLWISSDWLDAVPELVSQRRRWLNGAFFAAVYAQTHFTQIWNTDHSFRRKVALHIEFFYQFVNLLFSFFSLVSPLGILSEAE